LSKLLWAKAEKERKSAKRNEQKPYFK